MCGFLFFKLSVKESLFEGYTQGTRIFQD